MATYEAKFVGANKLQQAIGIAGVQPPPGASAGAVNNKTFNCIGNPPAPVRGSRLTYSSSARGVTPNPSEYQAEEMSLLFPNTIIEGNDAELIRHYISAEAMGFLQAGARALQAASYLAVKSTMQIRLRQLMVENNPADVGPDASNKHSAVKPYLVVPTYCELTNEGLQVTFDVLAKGWTQIENYGAGTTSRGTFAGS